MTERHSRAAADRAQVYALLSVAFDRPSEPLERVLEDDLLPAALVERAEAFDDPAVAETLDDLRVATKAADLETFQAAHATTFGVEAGPDVSPYEMAYRPGGLVTNTDQLADVAGFYDAFGLEVGEQRDRVDHLCTELEFVAELGYREAYLAEAGDEAGLDVVVDAQRLFLEDHLGRWVPRLRSDLEETAENDLYPSLASFFDAVVAADADRLGADPDVLEEAPDGPLESLFDDDGSGDWRCDTCAGAPSARHQ